MTWLTAVTLSAVVILFGAGLVALAGLGAGSWRQRENHLAWVTRNILHGTAGAEAPAVPLYAIPCNILTPFVPTCAWFRIEPASYGYTASAPPPIIFGSS